MRNFNQRKGIDMKNKEERILFLLALITFVRMIIGDDVAIECAMIICASCIVSAIKDKV